MVGGLIQTRLGARAVPVFGPSDAHGRWIWSDSGPWLYAVRCVRCFVLVSSLPLALRSAGTGYGSRRFGRRARLGTALLPVVPIYNRRSGDIVVIQYVGYSKAWLTYCVLFLVRIYWYRSRGEGDYLRTL